MSGPCCYVPNAYPSLHSSLFMQVYFSMLLTREGLALYHSRETNAQSMFLAQTAISTVPGKEISTRLTQKTNEEVAHVRLSPT